MSATSCWSFNDKSQRIDYHEQCMSTQSDKVAGSDLSPSLRSIYFPPHLHRFSVPHPKLGQVIGHIDTVLDDSKDLGESSRSRLPSTHRVDRVGGDLR